MDLEISLTLDTRQTEAVSAAWQSENARRALMLPPAAALTKEQFAAQLLVKVADSFATQKADAELKDARSLWLAADATQRAAALAALSTRP